MISERYAKAYKEVLEIISQFPNEEYKKIPREKIQFYKNNVDRDYEFEIDPEIDLEKQKISQEANAIIISLYRDYFITDEQRKRLDIVLKQNQAKKEEQKREKYNPEDIFKRNNKNDDKNANKVEPEDKGMQLIEYKKESFFTKLKKHILKLLNINQ
ncbi:MAG: hypothetical protein ACI4VN_02290 [Clostridia bacterium]